MQRLWIGAGSLAGLGAVAMAAFAAHDMATFGPDRVAVVRAGLQMEGWHALALLGCGLWAPRGGRLADWAGAAFLLGLLLFCGAVYALALGDVRVTEPLAPVGGTLLMVGWALLFLSVLRRH